MVGLDAQRQYEQEMANRARVGGEAMMAKNVNSQVGPRVEQELANAQQQAMMAQMEGQGRQQMAEQAYRAGLQQPQQVDPQEVEALINQLDQMSMQGAPPEAIDQVLSQASPGAQQEAMAFNAQRNQPQQAPIPNQDLSPLAAQATNIAIG